MAGSRIASEAARRGHQVTGICRSVGADEAERPAYPLVAGDAADSLTMGRLAAEHEAIIVCTRPTPGKEDEVVPVITAVLDAAMEHGRRVLVIGGAGPLRHPDDPNRRVIDDPLLVPLEWRVSAQASVYQLDVCKAHAAEWTYLSPPAVFEPGARTGAYRRGGSRLLLDGEGKSWISAEDLAIAAIDELEVKKPTVRHFTVST